MKTNIADVLGDAENQLENSNKLLGIGVTFIILTSFYLAYHSYHIFKRLAGGEAVDGASANAVMAVGCVEGSLIALIICHFCLFTTPAQKWIGLTGDAVTYAFLLFHTALNFRQNLFGYIDGFGEYYQSNGLPVLVFGATLATWAGIILLDVRTRMRLATLSALSEIRQRDLKGALKSKTATGPGQPVTGFARGRSDERGEAQPHPQEDQPLARYGNKVTPRDLMNMGKPRSDQE